MAREQESAPVVVPAAAVEHQIDDAVEEIDQVAEQLATLSVISEERYEELLDEVESCRESVESIREELRQNQSPSQTESPQLARVLEEMRELRLKMDAMEQKLQPAPNPSPETPSPVSPRQSESSTNGESQVDPEAVEPRPAPKEKRYRRI